MKKKFFVFVLSLVFAFTLVLPASAATYQYYDTFEGCTYHTYSHCESNRFQSMLQLYDCDGSYEDYTFYVMADVYFVDERGYSRHYDRYEYESTRIASVTDTLDVTLDSIVCTQKINNTVLFNQRVISAD